MKHQFSTSRFFPASRLNARVRVSFLCVAALGLSALSWQMARANNLIFTVNSTLDTPDAVPGDGICGASDQPCTLRAALQETNAQPGPDVIEFNIPSAGVQTIAPASALPTISSPVEIRGYTQPGSSANTLAVGSNAVLLIELNGQNAGNTANGLNISVAGSKLSGLAINRFLNGINFSGSTVSNNIVTGCFIGTDAQGLLSRPNRGAGILFDASGTNNLIGGTVVGDRNLVSGNTNSGVFLSNASNSNLVQGNLIGTNATGNVALGNGANGVYILDSRVNLVGGTAAGARNIVSGNGFGFGGGIPGIAIAAQLTDNIGNTLQNNYVGTNAAGMAKIPNAAEGLDLIGASGTLVENNLISGNNNVGIGLFDEATDNILRGNKIGLDAAGAPTLGNANGGIVVASIRDDATTQNENNRITQNSIAGNSGLGIDLGASDDNDTLTGDGVTPNDTGDADTGPNSLQNFPVLNSASGTGIRGTLNSLPNSQFFIECFVNPSNPSNSYQGQTPLLSTFPAVVNTNASGNGSFFFISNTPLPVGSFVTATATRIAASNGSGDTSEFSAAIRVTVQTFNSATSLASSINPSEFGQSVTFSARVGSLSAPAQTGNVTFRDGGTTIGIAPVNAQGVATFATSTLAQGTRPITAIYSGGSSLDGGTNFNPSTSATLNQVVNPVSACSTVVTTTADSGAGSLRSAIDCSNSVPFLQTISFSIPGAGAQTIAPASALPTVSNPVIIDGLTQNGAPLNTVFAMPTPQLPIEISGASAGANADGLNLAVGSTVRGLAVKRFRNGIVLSGAGNTTIEGSFLSANRQDGVSLISPSNLISRNVIAGQGRDGVRVESASAINNDISANNIADNGGLGINLVGTSDPADGVTPNDAGDPDSGPNGLQNAPVLTSAADNQITLTLNSVPNSEFFFEYFYNTPNDANSYEGERAFLSARQNGLLTDAQGNLTFSISRSLEAGQFITATVTRLSGNTRLETSEFSNAIAVGATKVSTTTSLTSSLNPAEVGKSVTFSATVKRASLVAAATSADAPGGSVTFYDGATTLGTASLNAEGVATFATTFTTPGTRNITAAYGGDADFLDNTSPALSQVINAASSCSTVVVNTNDSGAGSLRAAIDCSNATAGKQTISFDIAGTGVQTIAIATELPDISQPATLDGFTQPGAGANTNPVGQGLNARPLIAIQGGGANATPWALRLTGTDITIRGLIVNSIRRNGIRVIGNGNAIEGCFLGTNAAGTAFDTALTNNLGVALINASNNRIGGTTPAARNLVSGNFADGIQIFGGTGNLVQGNLIGTTISGAAGLRNTGDGVTISNSNGNTVGGTAAGARNLISGNGFTPDNPPRPNSDGVSISGNGNLVAGNFIGTDVTGTLKIANSKNGVTLNFGSANNTVGGNTAVARNLISGNLSDGIQVVGTGRGNQIRGNFIGTDVSATKVLGNGANGVQLFANDGTIIGGATAATRNIISGNGASGVRIEANSGGGAASPAADAHQNGAPQSVTSTSGNTVQGNFIGTNLAGNVKLANGDGGVYLYNAINNLIGGPGATAGAAPGNLISGNTGDGVEISSGISGGGNPSSDNEVQGNIIGLNAAGAAKLANTQSGVSIDESSRNLIGGGGVGAGNIISGNVQDGILVTDSTSRDNQISGNLIGTNAARANLGNAGRGAALVFSGPNIVGGGTVPGNANTIAFNGGAGVAIVFGFRGSIRKGISENSIFSNGGLGIDLEDDGVTPNDGDNPETPAIDPDSDTGANQLQNYPVLSSTNGTTLSGTLLSAPNTSFRIEFFASDAADPSGFGEGQRFVGSTSITTNASGVAAVSFTPATPVSGGQFVSATATDPLDNTSEFSRVVQVESVAIPTLSINNVRVTEGNVGTSTATFTVRLSAASSRPITVNFATANSSATQPADYTSRGGTLTFAPGSALTRQITVPIVGDTIDESDETFFVNLSAVSGATLADAQGIGSITDDDPTPTASIGDARVQEGNTGTRAAIFTVTLSNASAAPQNIGFSTANGTATAGSDYTARNGTLLIPAGKTTGTISIAVVGDALFESDETFFVNIAQANLDVTNAKNARALIGDAQGIGTIVNDDAPPIPPRFAVSDASVVEGDSGTRNAVFTVTRSVTINSAVSARFATGNGSATSGLDYIATSGTLSFAAGQTARIVSVPVLGDTIREANETFTLTLSQPLPSNALLSRPRGNGNIINDDLLSDLQITQTVAPNVIPVNSQAIFTLQVRNNGPDAAQNVVVTDTLPANATFVSATSAPTTRQGQVLTFNLGTLESGASRTLGITVRAPNTASLFINNARVSGTGAPDSNANNNSSTATAQTVLGPQNVNSSLQIGLGKLVRIGPYLPSLYRPGARFVQKVTIRNLSASAINGPLSLVLDGLPANVELVNRAGTTTLPLAGQPFVGLSMGGNGALDVGETISVQLEFRLRGNQRPGFTPRVLSGIGTP